MAMPSLPAAPPFRLRARVLTPLAAGGTRYLADGAIHVDARGRISGVADWAEASGREVGLEATARVPDHDVRPWLVLPGLVDLHTHIPQIANAGVGAGLDLLTWLERYTFPLERRFDAAEAERLGPLALRAFSAAGTTTVALGLPTLDVAANTSYSVFVIGSAASPAVGGHGLRAVITVDAKAAAATPSVTPPPTSTASTTSGTSSFVPVSLVVLALGAFGILAGARLSRSRVRARD